jgi:hypothetical protein
MFFKDLLPQDRSGEMTLEAGLEKIAFGPFPAALLVRFPPVPSIRSSFSRNFKSSSRDSQWRIAVDNHGRPPAS